MAVKILRCGIGELDVHDFCRSKGFSHNSLWQAMHLHIPVVAAEQSADARTGVQNVSNPGCERRNRWRREGILNSKDKNTIGRKHPYKLAQILDCKTPGNVL